MVCRTASRSSDLSEVGRWTIFWGTSGGDDTELKHSSGWWEATVFVSHSAQGRMFLVGCTMGPVLHFWYTWLDKVYVGKALKTVGKKVLLDQLIVSPAFGMWYFLGKDDQLVSSVLMLSIYLRRWSEWKPVLTHIWWSTVFMAGMSVMEGHTLSEGWLEFKSKFWEFYKVSCHICCVIICLKGNDANETRESL